MSPARGQATRPRQGSGCHGLRLARARGRRGGPRPTLNAQARRAPGSIPPEPGAAHHRPPVQFPIRSFSLSSIHPIIQSSSHPLFRPSIPSFSPPSTHPLIPSFIHPPIQSLNHPSTSWQSGFGNRRSLAFPAPSRYNLMHLRDSCFCNRDPHLPLSQSSRPESGCAPSGPALHMSAPGAPTASLKTCRRCWKQGAESRIQAARVPFAFSVHSLVQCVAYGDGRS